MDKLASEIKRLDCGENYTIVPLPHERRFSIQREGEEVFSLNVTEIKQLPFHHLFEPVDKDDECIIASLFHWANECTGKAPWEPYTDEELAEMDKEDALDLATVNKEFKLLAVSIRGKSISLIGINPNSGYTPYVELWAQRGVLAKELREIADWLEPDYFMKVGF